VALFVHQRFFVLLAFVAGLSCSIDDNSASTC
ncbi:hypothetical protein GCK32_021555, partial [Trichostrongylus colubriformis]